MTASVGLSVAVAVPAVCLAAEKELELGNRLPCVHRTRFFFFTKAINRWKLSSGLDGVYTCICSLLLLPPPAPPPCCSNTAVPAAAAVSTVSLTLPPPPPPTHPFPVVVPPTTPPGGVRLGAAMLAVFVDVMLLFSGFVNVSGAMHEQTDRHPCVGLGFLFFVLLFSSRLADA